MLNLDEVVEFIITEQAYLNSLVNPSKIESLSWKVYNGDDEMKIFKTHIKDRLLLIQQNKCVFCMKIIDRRSNLDGDREHFANKKRYPRFTFEKYNLFISCRMCNSIKGQKNTIDRENNDYGRCTYKIIHPYFDNVEAHLSFYDNALVQGLTDKGLRTIEMFKLYEPGLVREREKEFSQIEREAEDRENLNMGEEGDNILNLIQEVLEFRG